MKNKGGRPTARKQELIELRKKFIKQCLPKFSKAEIAEVLNIDKSQLSRSWITGYDRA